jgi:hypothetical protein
MVLPHPTPPYMYSPGTCLVVPLTLEPCSPAPDLINVLSSLNLCGQGGAWGWQGHRIREREGRGGGESVSSRRRGAGVDMWLCRMQGLISVLSSLNPWGQVAWGGGGDEGGRGGVRRESAAGEGELV